MSEHDQEGLEDLRVDRGVQRLSPAEQTELKEVRMRHPELDDTKFLAAIVDLTVSQIDEPLPDALRVRIHADACHYLDAIYLAALQTGNHPQGEAANPSPRLARSKIWQMTGWYVAALCLLAVIGGWYPRPGAARPSPSLAELRSHLLAEAPDVVQRSWVAAGAATPAGDEVRHPVQGDVIWSNAQQQGFMRFEGLPAVDPAVSEYQLWIFDASQDERYPVDGGVFAVDEETGEVIVRIDARIRVAQPKLFAITVEKPGGVVVSKRDRVMLIANVE